MKKLTKSLSLLLGAALLLCSLSLPASAAVVKDLKAAYSGINIVLDGEIITPMDAKGKIVQPFTLSGTTYLPIRAVANSLNLGVAWDQATKTVTLDSSNPDPKPDPDSSGTLYADFKAFGGTVCTLYFPSAWGNTFTVDNNSSQGLISIYDKNNSAYGGRLFTLRLFSDNSYRDLPKKKLLYDIIYQGKTYHLVKISPTDVQFGPGQQASYSAKSKEIDNIIDNLVFSSASRPVSAITKTIKASYPGVKIILDGQTVTPKDVNGKVVDPFIVGGTTYLPIRAIASALGLGVDWDQATKTVTLTSSSSQEPTPKPTATPEPTPTPKPYVANTLARAEMSGKPQMDMTIDGNGAVVYYDRGNHSIYKVAYENDAWTKPELLLDLNEPRTINFGDRSVTYQEMSISQVFYDSYDDCLLMPGSLSKIDNDGWSIPGISDTYFAIFAYKDGEISIFDDYGHFPSIFLDTMSDGRFLVREDGYTKIWDSYTGNYTSLGIEGYEDRFATQIGQDIYAGNAFGGETTIYKIGMGDLNRKKIIEVRGHATSQNGLFYTWGDDGVGMAIKPTGETKILFDPGKDVLVADLRPLPYYTQDLLVTPAGAFIFYDSSELALRAVYPNPEYKPDSSSTPSPAPTYPSEMIVGKWENADGPDSTLKIVSTGNANHYSVELTDYAWAQMYATWTYDGEYDETTGKLTCSNGTRVDSSRFENTTVYKGTGKAVFSLLSNGNLSWENLTEDPDDYNAPTQFKKVK